MKVVIDENLPPAMAKSLAALFKEVHEIVHVRERFGAKVTDTEWITALNEEGAWVVITADRHIARNKTEQQVFRSSQLIAFIFSRGLQKAGTLKQMERLMALWEIIETQVSIPRPGSMFELPMKSKRLKPV